MGRGREGGDEGRGLVVIGSVWLRAITCLFSYCYEIYNDPSGFKKPKPLKKGPHGSQVELLLKS